MYWCLFRLCQKLLLNMFIIPCKYKNNSPIIECVNSILKFHPDDYIVIVDSYSNDTSYFDLIPKIPNVKILNVKNNNYEIGALWKTYEQYPNESVYVLIQDTVIIKHSLSEFLENDDSYTFLYFNEPIQSSLNSKFFENTSYNFPKDNYVIPMCFGSNVILKNKIIKKFIEKGLHSSFLPTSKLESQYSERMIGFIMHSENIDLHKNNLDGNCLTDWSKFHNDGYKYIKKIFMHRD